MKTALKAIGGVAVLLIATVVAGVAVLKSTDFNRFKGDLDRLVQDATGREFTIGGDLDLNISLNPTLSVTDVTFANADWGRKQPMMTMQRLDAQVALLPLFSGKLDVDYIVLDGIDLLLQTDGKGLANWEFEAAVNGGDAQAVERGGIALNPQVRDVRLQNIHVTYVDGATGAELTGDLERADFSADSTNSPLKGDLNAVINGVEVRADAVLGSLGQLIAREGAAFPVHLKISASGLSAEIIGSVEQPSAGMTVDARVMMSADGTATLAKLSGAPLPELTGVELRANVKGGGTAYSFQGLDLKAGNSDFQGNADIDLGGKRPKVVAKLSSNILYPKELVGLKSDTTKVSAKSTSLFTTEPLPFDLLSTLDADVTYSAKRVSAEPVRMSDVRADVKLTNGRLVLNPLRATVEGGRFTARVTLNGSAKTPSVRLRASFRGLDAGALAALAGQGRVVSLKLDGEVDVKGDGASTQAIMGGLDGTTNVIGRSGEIFDKRFNDLIKDASKITCTVAKLPIVNGVATAETVMLDTDGILVTVTGNVDLGGERLHLTVNTDAKKPSLASFAVPVRIKGSFVEPKFDVDPAEAVVDTVGNIVKAPAELIGELLSDTVSLLESDKSKQEAAAKAAKDDPCIQALSRGKTTAKAKAVKKPTSKAKSSFEQPTEKPIDPSKSTGDPKQDLENVTKALEKLF